MEREPQYLRLAGRLEQQTSLFVIQLAFGSIIHCMFRMYMVCSRGLILLGLDTCTVMGHRLPTWLLARRRPRGQRAVVREVVSPVRDTTLCT